MKLMDMEKRRNRIRHILSVRAKRELRLTPGFQTHEALSAVAKKLPTDFEPYGKRKRSDDEIDGDCSGNCRWFQVLAGIQGRDWAFAQTPKAPERVC